MSICKNRSFFAFVMFALGLLAPFLNQAHANEASWVQHYSPQKLAPKYPGSHVLARSPYLGQATDAEQSSQMIKDLSGKAKFKEGLDSFAGLFLLRNPKSKENSWTASMLEAQGRAWARAIQNPALLSHEELTDPGFFAPLMNGARLLVSSDPARAMSDIDALKLTLSRNISEQEKTRLLVAQLHQVYRGSRSDLSQKIPAIVRESFERANWIEKGARDKKLPIDLDSSLQTLQFALEGLSQAAAVDLGEKFSKDLVARTGLDPKQHFLPRPAIEGLVKFILNGEKGAYTYRDAQGKKVTVEIRQNTRFSPYPNGPSLSHHECMERSLSPKGMMHCLEMVRLYLEPVILEASIKMLPLGDMGQNFALGDIVKESVGRNFRAPASNRNGASVRQAKEALLQTLLNHETGVTAKIVDEVQDKMDQGFAAFPTVTPDQRAHIRQEIKAAAHHTLAESAKKLRLLSSFKDDKVPLDQFLQEITSRKNNQGPTLFEQVVLKTHGDTFRNSDRTDQTFMPILMPDPKDMAKYQEYRAGKEVDPVLKQRFENFAQSLHVLRDALIVPDAQTKTFLQLGAQTGRQSEKVVASLLGDGDQLRGIVKTALDSIWQHSFPTDSKKEGGATETQRQRLAEVKQHFEERVLESLRKKILAADDKFSRQNLALYFKSLHDPNAKEITPLEKAVQESVQESMHESEPLLLKTIAAYVLSESEYPKFEVFLKNPKDPSLRPSDRFAFELIRKNASRLLRDYLALRPNEKFTAYLERLNRERRQIFISLLGTPETKDRRELGLIHGSGDFVFNSLRDLFAGDNRHRDGDTSKLAAVDKMQRIFEQEITKNMLRRLEEHSRQNASANLGDYFKKLFVKSGDPAVNDLERMFNAAIRETLAVQKRNIAGAMVGLTLGDEAIARHLNPIAQQKALEALDIRKPAAELSYYDISRAMSTPQRDFYDEHVRQLEPWIEKVLSPSEKETLTDYQKRLFQQGAFTQALGQGLFKPLSRELRKYLPCLDGSKVVKPVPGSPHNPTPYSFEIDTFVNVLEIACHSKEKACVQLVDEVVNSAGEYFEKSGQSPTDQARNFYDTPFQSVVLALRDEKKRAGLKITDCLVLGSVEKFVKSHPIYGQQVDPHSRSVGVINPQYWVGSRDYAAQILDSERVKKLLLDPTSKPAKVSHHLVESLDQLFSEPGKFGRDKLFHLNNMLMDGMTDVTMLLLTDPTASAPLAHFAAVGTGKMAEFAGQQITSRHSKKMKDEDFQGLMTRKPACFQLITQSFAGGTAITAAEILQEQLGTRMMSNYRGLPEPESVRIPGTPEPTPAELAAIERVRLQNLAALSRRIIYLNTDYDFPLEGPGVNPALNTQVYRNTQFAIPFFQPSVQKDKLLVASTVMGNVSNLRENLEKLHNGSYPLSEKECLAQINRTPLDQKEAFYRQSHPLWPPFVPPVVMPASQTAQHP